MDQRRAPRLDYAGPGRGSLERLAGVRFCRSEFGDGAVRSRARPGGHRAGANFKGAAGISPRVFTTRATKHRPPAFRARAFVSDLSRGRRPFGRLARTNQHVPPTDPARISTKRKWTLHP